MLCNLGSELSWVHACLDTTWEGICCGLLVRPIGRLNLQAGQAPLFRLKGCDTCRQQDGAAIATVLFMTLMLHHLRQAAPPHPITAAHTTSTTSIRQHIRGFCSDVKSLAHRDTVPSQLALPKTPVLPTFPHHTIDWWPACSFISAAALSRLWAFNLVVHFYNYKLLYMELSAHFIAFASAQILNWILELHNWLFQPETFWNQACNAESIMISCVWLCTCAFADLNVMANRLNYLNSTRALLDSWAHQELTDRLKSLSRAIWQHWHMYAYKCFVHSPATPL